MHETGDAAKRFLSGSGFGMIEKEKRDSSATAASE
jgi:hypothetical protein